MNDINDEWISLPDGSYPDYQINRAGDVRTLDGKLVPYFRPDDLYDPTEDTFDTYKLDCKYAKGITVGRYELIEEAFGFNKDDADS